MQTRALETKTHYEALDGLRGVAALIVVAFHTFEEFSYGDHVKQILNHGYLAVDFFFLLSGFVVAYAYDDRWDKMSFGGFVKRRIIRLQPMIVMGSLIGALLFYLQAGPVFPKIATTPVWELILIALLGATLLPLPYQFDVRGWYEMHPLDGPAWSLFFEYIANLLYALGLRKVSNRVLAILTALAAILIVEVAIRQGDVIGGWSTSLDQLHVGFARLLFP
ncbi:MAG: acyltransferase, partial [Terriglobus roseus]|nr:acyltransferase [Terriglobus roseus]